jgi:metabolite-proton symporter
VRTRERPPQIGRSTVPGSSLPTVTEPTEAGPRIVAAGFFAGGFVPRAQREEARRVTIPLLFLLQWDDEGNPRRRALDLFDALGGEEKTPHASPGGHTGTPWSASGSWTGTRSESAPPGGQRPVGGPGQAVVIEDRARSRKRSVKCWTLRILSSVGSFRVSHIVTRATPPGVASSADHPVLEDIVASSSDSPQVSIVRVAGASLIGTAIEFFDFFIFGTASALVFGELFFPDLDPLIGTLAAFATFGVAFVARPLGALIFGHFGDRVSRKRMLITSLMMMGLSTVAVGLLPTHAQVGILAPILLVVCRFIQGLALGGEWSGAVLMAVEHAPKNKRAFYGSWPQVGVPLGLVLATGMFWIVQQLPAAQLESWGWRVPFLVSAVLVALGLYIRLKIEDSPAFEAVKEKGQQERFPAGVVMRKAGGRVVIGALAMAAANIPFYMATVFALTYGASDGVSRNVVLAAVCLASLVQMATIPLTARFCDTYGRRPVLMVGCVATAVMAFPFFWLVDTHHPVAIIAAMLLALPICHALTYAPISAFLPELFPTQLRYSGSGIAYTLGGLLFSAPVPFISAALFDSFGAAWPLSLYIVVGGVLTFVAVAVSRESRDDEIAWSDDPAERSTDGSAAGPERISAAL